MSVSQGCLLVLAVLGLRGHPKNLPSQYIEDKKLLPVGTALSPWDWIMVVVTTPYNHSVVIQERNTDDNRYDILAEVVQLAITMS